MFPYGTAIIICWIIFWVYWLIAAFSSKQNISTNYRRFFRIRIGFILLVLILVRLLNKQNYTFENRLLTSNQVVLATGLVIFLLGLLLAVWARLYLGKNWGAPMSQKKDPELVTSGPYRYVRHPIYSGLMLAFLGATLTASLFWLVVFVISGVYFIYSALVEEKHMIKQFPKTYTSYKSRTKMLFPFIF
jgi:protein-S-isoprenylcysteine O-methyltransferase Ste14